MTGAIVCPGLDCIELFSMIPFFSVRHSLLVPPVFILLFLVVFLSLTAVNTVISFGDYYSDTGQFSMEFVLQKIPYAMSDTLPASILLTILLMLFRLVRSQGNKLIGNLLLIASGFFILVFGMMLLVPALPGERTYARSFRDYAEEQRFNRFEDIILYPPRLSLPYLPNVLVVDPGREDWKLYAFPTVTLAVTQAGLGLSGEGLNTKRISSETGTRFGSLLAADPFIRQLLSAFTVFTNEIKRLARTRTIEFFILGFAFVFFFASSGVLLKVTKWPLLNLSLLLFVMTGALVLYAFYQTQVVPEIGKYIKTGILSTATPTIVMLILGLLFSLVDLVFIPSQFWRKDIQGV